MTGRVVLVTGSQGFIGSAICKELLANGHEVIGIDSYVKYGYVKREHDSNPNFKLIEADICNLVKNSTLWEKLVESEIEYIVHAAASIGGIKYFHTQPYDILQTNLEIDLAILKFALALHSNKDLRRLVVLSSSMVFESANIFPSRETDLEKIPMPKSSYGFSKLALEFLVKSAYDQYKLPFTIARPFNASGMGEEDFATNNVVGSHVLPDLIVKCLRGQAPLEILGNGNQIRHFTAVKDIARGIRMAMESPLAENEDFNISSDEMTSVLELAEMVWKKIWPLKPFRYKCLTPFKHDVQMRSPDTTKAKEILKFEALTPLSETIGEVIDYIKTHQALD